MTHTTITAAEYHQRSKHALQAYARGPQGLDWTTQPDPFRRFAGCGQIDLPLRCENYHSPMDALYRRELAPAAVNLDSLAALFELAMGLSAWKHYGDSHWALRNNPSSGNLHPTESYLLNTDPVLPPGVYHYQSYQHALEQRCMFPGPGTQPGLLIGLSSIHWREAWKYGERAWRYCQHDAGHALAAFSYAAASLGWRIRLLEPLADTDIATLLGLDRAADFNQAETETPDLLLQVLVTPGQTGPDIPALLDLARCGHWQGQANCLTPTRHAEWPVIDRVSTACRKPATAGEYTPAPAIPALLPGSLAPAQQIIRQRRSAQAFDGISHLPLKALFRMLDCVQRRRDTPPLDSLPWAPRVHLALLVHRVENLPAGLYVLARSQEGENLLRENLDPDFTWNRVEQAPASLRLFQLVQGDARDAARVISCHQDIAADSAFTLGMLAAFDNTLTDAPWRYRQLFWEAGMLGQVLYLEAEAAGVRGTGIGCYFDDAFHDMLGIRNTRVQSLYHFTVGTAVEDTRLQTRPAYAHLQQRLP